MKNTYRFVGLAHIFAIAATFLLTSSSSFAERMFYLSSSSASDWVKQNPKRPEARLINDVIANTPQFIWLNNSSLEFFRNDAARAKAQSTILPFLLYDIPGRDNGNYSLGGLHSPAEYMQWVTQISQIIGYQRSMCIIEPDAIGLASGLTPIKRAERYEMLSNAVSILKSIKYKHNVEVYIDVSYWLSPQDAAAGLKKAGVVNADGFCLNTANFQRLVPMIIYGRAVSKLLGGKHFIIDTSRCGNGPYITKEADPWCNPPGRAVGARPTFETGVWPIDAYVWAKRPGESDGSCRGGPPAGQFWPEYAYELARNAHW